MTPETWGAALRAASRAAARHLGRTDAEADVVAADAAIEAVASCAGDAALASRIAMRRARQRAADVVRRRRGRGVRRRPVDQLPSPPPDDGLDPLRQVLRLLPALPPAERAAISRGLAGGGPPLSAAERQARHRAIHRLRRALVVPAER